MKPIVPDRPAASIEIPAALDPDEIALDDDEPTDTIQPADAAQGSPAHSVPDASPVVPSPAPARLSARAMMNLPPPKHS